MTNSNDLVAAPDAALAKTAQVKLAEKKRIERSLVRLTHLSKLMDDQFELPLVKKKIGLDPIIGLIAGGGDWIGWAVGAYIIWEAMRLKVPMGIMFKIARTITLDFLMGYVPVAGDIVDILYKSNKRSVELLLKHFETEQPDIHRDRVEIPDSALEKPTSPWPIRYAFGITMILFFGVLALVPLTLTYYFFEWWFTNP